MKVYVKDLAVDMEIKNTGIELAVCDTEGKQIGDLIVTKTKLIWCNGKTKRDNGLEVSWKDFIEWMNS